ncbi:MAG TPA: TIGR03118 family protein [Myxococcota bacterium]|nr:TIGR03118 family protein [Myxococcota bacterium]
MFRGNSLGSAAGLCAALLFSVVPQCMSADISYFQTNLVSDVPGLAAHTDPNLKNPWGVGFSPTSPFWVSDQGSGTATLYDAAGNTVPLVVSTPSIGSPPTGPTGQVFNGTSSFNLPDGSSAEFVFDTLDGQILGWNAGTGTTAVSVVTSPGAMYTGLALANVGGSNYLYAVDIAGHINVFNTSFGNVTSTTFAGKFVDPNPVAGFNPFNIQNINGNLYVTYAAVNAKGVGLPGGYVDEFDSSGTLLQRIATGGSLYAPWGITLAPASFGHFGGDLLIGQFGNGEILVFDPSTNQFLGTINGTNGNPIVNPFLWSLEFRTGGTAVNPNALYFTAGYNNQLDGLFGEIQAVPEPRTGLLVMLGVVGLGVTRRRQASTA